MCGTTISMGPVNENCAIAIAVREIFPKAMIGHRTFMPMGLLEPMLSVDLPDRATKFIELFDSLRFMPHERLDLPELSFEIVVPNEIIDAIGIDSVKGIVERSETLELV